MKLTKQQAKMHQEACDLLKRPYLGLDEREFVLEHWREDAQHLNGVSGAFFTPAGLARDLAIEACYCGPVRLRFGGFRNQSIVDLCAGIGSLAYACHKHLNGNVDLVCVEINPDYVAVGKKILPEARWVCADAFDYACASPLLAPDTELPFDTAISNPPFGNVKTHKNKFGRFEYDLIHHARTLARDGVFIIPQGSAPFTYSGSRNFRLTWPEHYLKFSKETKIDLTPNCGMDTSMYSEEWTIKPPPVEIVLGFQAE